MKFVCSNESNLVLLLQPALDYLYIIYITSGILTFHKIR